MLIRHPDDLPSSEITPEGLYQNRRAFVGTAGALALGTVLAPSAVQALSHTGGQEDKVTPEEDATSYNNFYEFGTDKEEPKELAKDFKPMPWTVTVEGLVKAPRPYAYDELLGRLPVQDRTYRMRCVEAWSMVIPWQGVQLSDIIKRVEPLPSAKFVEFTTLYDPKRMPGQRRAVLPWPYKEGLRMDEAMHPLTLFATGMYGKPLPNQNGAPLRLVTPWKYGFKGIKSIVKIRFTDRMPNTTWNDANPSEYGFYANVNPAVDHPRWSQAKERRIGEFLRRNTLPFNGYADQVASLYSGMDLRKFY
ncbi:MAG: protein-methionine-sulfoxide reductase catalytic subunit MsrP [Gemmatimonas sp.]|jgi:sulfoxide reductase catalytic subunit YedY|uniref:protein-methionine-sulfoxide reductase catalytic subunit MsrP n=1 Tax=Gemmatimonas sp. TaxID=1962908 RepID=UPI00391F4C6E|nr:protein-methionine-sulfoxide reductase catalytic subunit MsrP [Gemmatimonadota bacterium]